jgi:hypothetical protein
MLLVGACVLAAACGDSGSSTDGTDTIGDGSSTSGSGGGGSAVCDSVDFQAQVTAFCKTQNPPAPAAGAMGASCTGDPQCDSNLCLEPFGQAAYCSLECPQGSECPQGFSCQDTGAGFSACYEDVCIYGGTDTSDCTAQFLAEIDSACNSSCTKANVTAWVDCLSGAGRLCGNSDADQACGAERGIVESCCLGCDAGSW